MTVDGTAGTATTTAAAATAVVTAATAGDAMDVAAETVGRNGFTLRQRYRRASDDEAPILDWGVGGFNARRAAEAGQDESESSERVEAQANLRASQGTTLSKEAKDVQPAPGLCACSAHGLSPIDLAYGLGVLSAVFRGL